MEQNREVLEEERKAAVEHQDVLLDIRAMIASNSGKKFFKYIFKHLGVGEVPPQGLEIEMLREILGLNRAGNSIYKLVCEADFTIAASLLAQVEKERYDELYAQNQVQRS